MGGRGRECVMTILIPAGEFVVVTGVGRCWNDRRRGFGAIPLVAAVGTILSAIALPRLKNTSAEMRNE